MAPKFIKLIILKTFGGFVIKEKIQVDSMSDLIAHKATPTSSSSFFFFPDFLASLYRAQALPEVRHQVKFTCREVYMGKALLCLLLKVFQEKVSSVSPVSNKQKVRRLSEHSWGLNACPQTLLLANATFHLIHVWLKLFSEAHDIKNSFCRKHIRYMVEEK